MNIQDQIKIILDNRKNQLPKVEAEIERWNKISSDLKHLNQVTHSILQEHALPDDLAHLLRNISIESIDNKIPNVLADLSWLKQRFSRNTINIGVSGRARVGKSTLLQKISGLGEQQIPTGSGLPVTAVRSQIYHNPIQHRAIIEFHDFASFRDSVLQPYHKELQLLDKLPKTAQEFQNMQYPQRIAELAEAIQENPSKAALLNRLNEMHRSFASYRDLLESSEREKIFELDQLREYVAYPTNEQVESGQHIRKYLAVKEAKIECSFPTVEVNNLGIIDLPGLGELAADAERHHVQGLKNDIDLVILVKRPLEGMGYWGAEDGKATDLLDEARGYIESRKDFVFILINTGGVNQQQIISLRDHIKREANEGQDGSLYNIIEADNADVQSVQTHVLNPVLEHLASRLGVMDQQIIEGTLRQYSTVESQIKILLNDLTQAIQQISYSGSLREEIDNLATDLRNELSEQLTDMVLSLKHKAKSDDGAEFVDRVELISQNIISWINNGFNSQADGLEAWKKNASKITKRDRNNGRFAVDELNRIRVEISKQYCQLDNYFNDTLFKDLFVQVAETLGENLGALLDNKTEKEAIEYFAKCLAEANEPCETLSTATENLLALKLEYRTQFHPRVRAQLDNLNYQIENAEGEQEIQFVGDVGDADYLYQQMSNLAKKAAYDTKKALLEEVRLPNLVLFAAAEQFEDELIRSGDSEREFKRLAHSYSHEIWPNHFGEIDASNARVSKLKSCVNNIYQWL
ncbi:hypothetical protein [Acinetobacter sp. YH01026]|uniref:hypothetical protein n=1 Tax=Acinetobacter sp. YH01026 TaxID=2601039 RepID=UPI0015D33597|nr:hypothetical protein [Acinetobacter sp. YH01026]